MIRKNGKPADHTACTGCALCLLVCPVWHQTRDIRLTPYARAKALQQGATALEIAASIASCTLCAACVPVCPQQIDLVGMILEQRRRQPLAPGRVATRMLAAGEGEARPVATPTLLLAGDALRADSARLSRILALLGEGGTGNAVALAHDDGADLGLALEAGAQMPEDRVRRFLDALRGAKRLIVAEGMLMHVLRRRLAALPGVRVTGLGEALSALEAVQAKLRATDLYVIEPRAFHADYERLVGHYERLRTRRGCVMNLDLQRIAVAVAATTAQNVLGLPGIDCAEQARWILQGRSVERVVVEDANDRAVFARVFDRPVVHIADL